MCVVGLLCPLCFFFVRYEVDEVDDNVEESAEESSDENSDEGSSEVYESTGCKAHTSVPACGAPPEVAHTRNEGTLSNKRTNI